MRTRQGPEISAISGRVKIRAFIPQVIGRFKPLSTIFCGSPLGILMGPRQLHTRRFGKSRKEAGVSEGLLSRLRVGADVRQRVRDVVCT